MFQYVPTIFLYNSSKNVSTSITYSYVIFIHIIVLIIVWEYVYIMIKKYYYFEKYKQGIELRIIIIYVKYTNNCNIRNIKQYFLYILMKINCFQKSYIIKNCKKMNNETVFQS